MCGLNKSRKKEELPNLVDTTVQIRDKSIYDIKFYCMDPYYKYIALRKIWTKGVSTLNRKFVDTGTDQKRSPAILNCACVPHSNPFSLRGERERKEKNAS